MSDLPEEQQAIRAKCFHPSGSFIEFAREEVEQSIPDRFEKIVGMYPDRLAVKMGDHALSYSELNRAVNRVAHAVLAKQGHELQPVALLFRDKIQAVTGILGALKAGKFYVPLDPSFPQARIVSILADSGARLVLADKASISLARTLTDDQLQVIDIEAINTNVYDETPSLSLSPDGLVCILYTSGSTGQPKGVVQNHRNLLHWVMVHTNNLHICRDDRLSFLQSYSVPSCAHNLFGCLLNGASLFPFNPQLGGFRLAKWLVDEEITIYHSVPMLFRQAIEALTGNEEFPALRVIRLSGAATTQRDVSLYKKFFSEDCILVQVMGSTEAGTIPHYFLDKTTELDGAGVPVGYAEPDAEIILLDENGCKVSEGQAGEIAMKSRYLAPGYWQNPKLTKTRFLADPQGGKQRVYLTGDLGRMDPDGCLFYLGRKDFQVNVRGYRVDVGEVESAILTLELVKAAVVQGQPDAEGNQRLVAYIVPATGEAPTQSEIRRSLERLLPAYMIPSAFVFLETLPLLLNGKVDRKALPEPEPSRPELEQTFVAPRTPVEEVLAGIWSRFLGLERVGVHDDFFELGGHSLSAAQVISRVYKTFEVEISLRTLFENPTIAELAVQITEAQAKKIAPKDMADVLADLESLSDEEAERLLADLNKPV